MNGVYLNILSAWPLNEKSSTYFLGQFGWDADTVLVTSVPGKVVLTNLQPLYLHSVADLHASCTFILSTSISTESGCLVLDTSTHTHTHNQNSIAAVGTERREVEAIIWDSAFTSRVSGALEVIRSCTT